MAHKVPLCKKVNLMAPDVRHVFYGDSVMFRTMQVWHDGTGSHKAYYRKWNNEHIPKSLHSHNIVRVDCGDTHFHKGCLIFHNPMWLQIEDLSQIQPKGWIIANSQPFLWALGSIYWAPVALHPPSQVTSDSGIHDQLVGDELSSPQCENVFFLCGLSHLFPFKLTKGQSSGKTHFQRI